MLEYYSVFVAAAADVPAVAAAAAAVNIVSFPPPPPLDTVVEVIPSQQLNGPVRPDRSDRRPGRRLP